MRRHPRRIAISLNPWLKYETSLSWEAVLSPYDPGRLSGPPEDCYPPEGRDIIAGPDLVIDPITMANLRRSPTLSPLSDAAIGSVVGHILQAMLGITAPTESDFMAATDGFGDVPDEPDREDR